MPTHRILVVDDNPTNLAIIEEMLRDECDLRLVTTGEEALAIITDFQPDLILLDIMMPGLNGYEVCRRVRAYPPLQATKIIMVSAKVQLEERLEGYRAGADDYMTKPFDEDELLAKVRVYLRLKSVEEIDKLKSDVLKLLSHETETPLHGILAPASMMLDQPDLDPAIRQTYLNAIIKHATRLQQMVEKVMKFSSLRTGTAALNRTPALLSDIIRQAADRNAAKARSREVQITCDIQVDGLLELDRAEITTALAALIDNAVKHTPASRTVAIRCDEQAGQTAISVIDEGAGIAQDMLARILDEQTTAAAPSAEPTGLSLAIVRQIARRHGGSLKVSSKPGVGATFTLLLPGTRTPCPTEFAPSA